MLLYGSSNLIHAFILSLYLINMRMVFLVPSFLESP